MTTISTWEFSANEKDMEVLMNETRELRKLLFAAHEEMQSIQKILTAVLAGPVLKELESRRENLLEELRELEEEYVEFNRKIHNHRYDLQGMRECEDVSCESFYLSEHQSLTLEIEKFLTRFEGFKTNIIRYTGDLLEHLS